MNYTNYLFAPKNMIKSHDISTFASCIQPTDHGLSWSRHHRQGQWMCCAIHQRPQRQAAANGVAQEMRQISREDLG